MITVALPWTLWSAHLDTKRERKCALHRQTKQSKRPQASVLATNFKAQAKYLSTLNFSSVEKKFPICHKGFEAYRRDLNEATCLIPLEFGGRM